MTTTAHRGRRGQIISRGKDRRNRPTWLLRVYLGTTPDGTKRYSNKTVKGSRSDAEQELTAMLRSVDTKSFVAASKETVKEYLGSWLRSKVDVTGRTRVDYEQRLGWYVYGPLGHYRLQDVDARVVQEMISKMASTVSPRTGQPLSPRTIEYTKAILHAAFEDAVRAKLLYRNPVEHVKIPKKTRRAPSVLTMKQVGVLLEKTKEDALRALWALLLTSGLRPQEALALKWTDLELEESWLSVQRTLADDGHGNFSLVDTAKTDGSVRRIGLPESTVEVLKGHKARQNAEILLAGTRYGRQDLVFATSLGTPLDMNKVRRRWKAALKAAKLPAVRLYDTRHSHATALLHNGADIAWVAARLGHADIHMTQRHYAHVLPETQRKMGELTEEMLKKANGTAE
jgi:integrase